MAMKAHFSTPELKMIRQQIEEAERKEEELEKKKDERELTLALSPTPSTTAASTAPSSE